MASRRLLDLYAISQVSASIARKSLLIHSQQLVATIETIRRVTTTFNTEPARLVKKPSSFPPVASPLVKKRPSYKHDQPTLDSSSMPATNAAPLVGLPQTHKDEEGQSELQTGKLTDGINADVFYLRHGLESDKPSIPLETTIHMDSERRQVAVDRVKKRPEIYTAPEDVDVGGVFRSNRGRCLVMDRSEDVARGVKEMVKIQDVLQKEEYIPKTLTGEGAQIENTDSTKVEYINKITMGAEKESGVTQPKYRMTPARVPTSRVSRLLHYGGLAAGMMWGAAGESVKRAATGVGDTTSSVMFSEANVERLVKKLSRMRGAALKLGQMMSFQDSMFPAPIQEVLSRVQDSADYMPSSQRDYVLTQNLGKNWRSLFSEFTEIPMAAASIGQVHAAKLASTDQPVAIKIQYPGVAASISSDLDNLSVLLTASRLLPKGLYLDKTIENARTELAWECDYEREAACAKRFAEILKPESDVFRVPRIFDEASGPQVLTMELMQGTAVTKCIKELSQQERDFIGTQILGLCFREIAQYQFMQTDPNWTNFLWNKDDQKIELLDFGASREYPLFFIRLYTSLLAAAARSDRSAINALSVKLGYLTGFESKTMANAHITSILTLAEPFSKDAPDVYDFATQTVTDRVKSQIPLMIKERLTPPPEETYSLHRKLSGAFLLCARLGSKVKCRYIFEEALEKVVDKQSI